MQELSCKALGCWMLVAKTGNAGTGMEKWDDAGGSDAEEMDFTRCDSGNGIKEVGVRKWD